MDVLWLSMALLGNFSQQDSLPHCLATVARGEGESANLARLDGVTATVARRDGGTATLGRRNKRSFWLRSTTQPWHNQDLTTKAPVGVSRWISSWRPWRNEMDKENTNQEHQVLPGLHTESAIKRDQLSCQPFLKQFSNLYDSLNNQDEGSRGSELSLKQVTDDCDNFSRQKDSHRELTSQNPYLNQCEHASAKTNRFPNVHDTLSNHYDTFADHDNEYPSHESYSGQNEPGRNDQFSRQHESLASRNKPFSRQHAPSSCKKESFNGKHKLPERHDAYSAQRESILKRNNEPYSRHESLQDRKEQFSRPHGSMPDLYESDALPERSDLFLCQTEPLPGRNEAILESRKPSVGRHETFSRPHDSISCMNEKYPRQHESLSDLNPGQHGSFSGRREQFQNDNFLDSNDAFSDKNEKLTGCNQISSSNRREPNRPDHFLDISDSPLKKNMYSMNPARENIGFQESNIPYKSFSPGMLSREGSTFHHQVNRWHSQNNYDDSNDYQKEISCSLCGQYAGRQLQKEPKSNNRHQWLKGKKAWQYETVGRNNAGHPSNGRYPISDDSSDDDRLPSIDSYLDGGKDMRDPHTSQSIFDGSSNSRDRNPPGDIQDETDEDEFNDMISGSLYPEADESGDIVEDFPEEDEFDDPPPNDGDDLGRSWTIDYTTNMPLYRQDTKGDTDSVVFMHQESLYQVMKGSNDPLVEMRRSSVCIVVPPHYSNKQQQSTVPLESIVATSLRCLGQFLATRDYQQRRPFSRSFISEYLNLLTGVQNAVQA